MTKVLVNFIQDRSGSMQSVWQETLSGFRVFVNNLRQKGPQEGVEYLFSLTTFDTLVETPVIAQPIASVDPDILAKHGPRGSTALYDAVGITIQNTDEHRHDAEKIIVVVVTDGHENSSREWTKDRLHSAVDAKLNAGNWTFTYLGTQPETWDDAQAFGVSRGSTGSYRPGMSVPAYAAVAGSVHRLSSSRLSSSRDLIRDFLSNEEAAAAGMKKEPEPKEPEKAEETAPPEPKASSKGHWR